MDAPLDGLNMYLYKRVLCKLRHPTSLFLALLTRFILTVSKAWNKRWDLEDILISPIHIELVDIDIVVLGFLLVGVHGTPTFDTVLCLLRISRQQVQQVLWRKHKRISAIAVMTVICFAKSIGMFFLVREIWTSHLCIVVQCLQCLHLFPALATVLLPISKGMLVSIVPELTSNINIKTEIYKRAVRRHKVSTYLVIAYDVFNGAIIYSEVSYWAWFLLLILLGLACEGALTYMLLHPQASKYKLPPQGCLGVKSILKAELVRLKLRKVKEAEHGYDNMHPPIPVKEYDPKLLKETFGPFINQFGDSHFIDKHHNM